MRANAKWALGADVRVLSSECRDGRWVVSALGLGAARCPECEVRSTRRHGWQVRQLQDLPVQGTPVTLEVRLTRWRCQNRRCGRQTFVDRLPQVAPSFARRTCRVAELARLVGHAAGGRPAERLLTRLGLQQSDDTVLRNLKRHVADSRKDTATRVLGIDDWAWQKGCRYGTIMVDLGRREVVDVLSDRSAEVGARWLREHPGVEIVGRDRCGVYAEGARRGAPQARQVADRFHWLQNLRQTIEQQLSRPPRPPTSLEDTAPQPASADACGGHRRQPGSAEHRALVRAGRRAILTGMFDRVKALRFAGHGLIAIVRQTGFNWRTVAKWARLEELPTRNVMASKPSTPRSFENHLSQRWAEGCTSGRKLLPEIKSLGYTGSLSHLERLLSHWRLANRSVVADARTPATPVTATPTPAPAATPMPVCGFRRKPPTHSDLMPPTVLT